jgi:hypothetical protein
MPPANDTTPGQSGRDAALGGAPRRADDLRVRSPDQSMEAVPDRRGGSLGPTGDRCLPTWARASDHRPRRPHRGPIHPEARPAPVAGSFTRDGQALLDETLLLLDLPGQRHRGPVELDVHTRPFRHVSPPVKCQLAPAAGQCPRGHAPAACQKPDYNGATPGPRRGVMSAGEASVKQAVKWLDDVLREPAGGPQQAPRRARAASTSPLEADYLPAPRRAGRPA